MKNKLRILIAEDHETVRAGFKLIVEAQDDMKVVGQAGDGRAAVESARTLQPDVVLIDISMPELNGLKAVITGKVFEVIGGTRNKLRGDTSGQSLSGREREVFRRIALGYSNKEIAEKMDISVKTVETHKANALKKT